MNKHLLLSASMASMLLLSGCSQDKDFDLDSIDTTIGVNLNDLDIPQSSTSKIKLKEILELEGSSTIILDEKSNYLFKQDAEKIDPVHPFIDAFTVAERQKKGFDVALEIPDFTGYGAKKRAASTNTISGSGLLQTFNYSATLPDGVNDVETVNATASLELHIIFPEGLSAVVPQADKLSLILPDFIKFSNVKSTCSSYVQKGGTFTFTNVPTNQDLIFSADASQLVCNMPATEIGAITRNGKEMSMDGNIFMEFEDADPVLANVAKLKSNVLKSTFSMGDFIITGGSGHFSPEIEPMTGSITINNIPDFLQNEDVVLDLDDVRLFVSVDNDMDLGGFVDGKLISRKGNQTTATVVVPQFNVNANGKTDICICSKANDELKRKYTCVEVPTLSQLIQTIPDEIEFIVNAKADDTKLATFQLGHEYTLSASAGVEAMISFGENARIVYHNDFDGWNADLEDMELKQGTQVTIISDVESTVPLNLLLKAALIDKNGNEITDVPIDTKEVLVVASVDGKTPSKAEIKIQATDNASNLMSRLDGLRMIMTGSSKVEGGQTVTGVPLNGETQYLEFKNIRINVNGQIIYDAN
ncbi:MAG: hypothetical protein MJZ29_07715 [Bacteroidaceae bacterium]|nr:hypothetical protein [Bacteroidaceae bacterium]